MRAAARALPSPDQLFALPRRRFDDLAGRLERGARISAERRRARLAAVRLSPATLERGIAEERRHLQRAAERLPNAAATANKARRLRLDTIARRLTAEPFVRRNAEQRRHLERAAIRLPRIIDTLLADRRRKFAQAARLVGSLSVQGVLERGFALVSREDGTLAKRAGDVASGERLAIRFADGSVGATADGPEQKRRPSAARSPKPAPDDQGALF